MRLNVFLSCLCKVKYCTKYMLIIFASTKILTCNLQDQTTKESLFYWQWKKAKASEMYFDRYNLNQTKRAKSFSVGIICVNGLKTQLSNKQFLSQVSHKSHLPGTLKSDQKNIFCTQESKLTKEPSKWRSSWRIKRNFVIEKDCQAAPYPKPDEMFGEHGHYEASPFGQCQSWFRNKAAKCVDKDITRVGKAETEQNSIIKITSRGCFGGRQQLQYNSETHKLKLKISLHGT